MQGELLLRYQVALVEYLRSQNEVALERAFDIGRTALAQGRGVVDLVAVHDAAMASVLQDRPNPLEAVALGNRVLSEALAPHEMALRGFHELNRTRALFDANPVPMCVCDAESHQFLAVNNAALRCYGYRREEFLALSMRDIRRGIDDAQITAELMTAQEAPRTVVHRHVTKYGTDLFVEVAAHPIAFEQRPARLLACVDVTNRMQIEEQLRHAQKMEAVGQLAGGIAHDFNNLLSVILSFSDITLENLRLDDPMREDIVQIREAGERAAGLTRQLLSFSRQQAFDLVPVDLNDLIVGTLRMLRRVIGENIELTTRPGADLRTVLADPGGLEQVVMNLVVNARDAMPNGGRLTIETSNIELTAASVHDGTDIAAGSYVLLTVGDTGVGMDGETRERIFDPFFTTKGPGRGTGLGLSIVFGIVRQLGGQIDVYSEVGVGTVFKVYLPAAERRGAEENARAGADATSGGTETILVVDDESRVRTLVETVLRRRGYRVLAAATPADAMRLCDDFDGTIHLLLTDVVMPEMSGPVLASRIRERRPDIRVLCMSGFTRDLAGVAGGVEPRVPLLQKPITPDVLSRKVREVLESP